MFHGAYPEKGTARDIIAKKAGFSGGVQYERIAKVADTMLPISETTVADVLMNYYRILDRLEVDAPLVNKLSENQSNIGLHTPVKITAANLFAAKPKEPDRSIVLNYYDGLNKWDTPFIKLYENIVLLLQCITDCIRQLPRIEHIILQRIYLERMSVEDVAFHMRMTKKELYNKRTEAIQQLTLLVMNAWMNSEKSIDAKEKDDFVI